MLGSAQRSSGRCETQGDLQVVACSQPCAQRSTKRIAGGGGIDRFDDERVNVLDTSGGVDVGTPAAKRHDHSSGPEPEQALDATEQLDFVFIRYDDVAPTQNRLVDRLRWRRVEHGY